MQFASLTGLWFALAMPMIILMYLFKRKYIDTEVSSHLLWNRVLKEMEANRPWQKLRNNLLLFIQLLVAALLVFALMQPFTWVEDTQKEHVLLVMDQSASMDSFVSTEASVTRLEEAKQRAMEWIRNQAQGQQITLIGMGEQADVLFNRETNIQVMEQALSDMGIHYGRTVYKETMSLAASLTRNEDAEIRLFTDGQWTDSLQGLSFHVPVIVDHMDIEEVNNISIVQFGVKRNQSLDEGVSAVATIKNWGDQTLSLDASIFGGSELQKVQKETLEPGQQKTIFFNELPIADYYRFILDVGDLLTVDNTAYAFLSGDQPKKALLLSEGNFFLEKAMKLNDVSLLKTQLNEQGVMVLPQSGFDFIVVDSIQREAVKTVEWQDLLNEKPVWYINYDMNESTQVIPNTDYKIEEHPITQYIHFQDTHIATAKTFKRFPWGEAIISAGDTPLVYAGSVQGNPNLLFTFDIHHSDLPLRSEFPVFVQNVVEWLSKGQASSLGSVMAEEQIEISLSSKTIKAHWAAEAADGRLMEADTANRVVSNVQTAPGMPGLYKFVEMDQQGTEIQTRWLEVVMDPRESSLSYINPLDISIEENPLSVEDASALQSDKASEGYSPNSLIPWIVILLLGLILIEWGVYQRGSSI